MCLIVFQFHNHPNYKLIAASNRDEFYERPATSAQFWDDQPRMLAGRDLTGMGTWLGVTKSGRFAALTNYRDPRDKEHYRRSRGEIVRDYLASNNTAGNFLTCLQQQHDAYAGFNIIAGDPDHLVYYNNIQNKMTTVSPGVHGLSNAFLDTPWPKVTKGKQQLAAYTEQNKYIETAPLFNILADEEKADDDNLPQTGVSLDFERCLSPIFIQTHGYGTRSSTVLLVDWENHVTFAERTYHNGTFAEENQYSFTIT